MAMLRGRTALLRGSGADAVAAFAEGAIRFDDLSDPGPHRWCLAGLVLGHALDGRAHAAEHTAEALLRLNDAPVSTVRLTDADVDRAQAWAAWSAGETATAHEVLLEAIGVAAELGELGMELALLHDLARLGAANAAAERLGHRLVGVQGPLAAARRAHIEGMARQSTEALRRAAEGFARCGTLLFAAEASSKLDDPSARARIAGWLGMIGPIRSPCLDPRSSALTGRQLDVARLAGAGQPSKTIAAELGLSVRTVENHLQAVYKRLGISSRAELALALGEVSPFT
jgi:DNA-binding CsgD family transcriptional regulator